MDQEETYNIAEFVNSETVVGICLIQNVQYIETLAEESNGIYFKRSLK